MPLVVDDFSVSRLHFSVFSRKSRGDYLFFLEFQVFSVDFKLIFCMIF